MQAAAAVTVRDVYANKGDTFRPGDVAVDHRPRDLAALLSEEVARHGEPGWTVRVDEAWAHATCAASTLPVQGWKLHVSATLACVDEMLRVCAPILLGAGCCFKVARDDTAVRFLTSPLCPRGNAGKVLTVYPVTATKAVRIAHLLDAATAGLVGPRIANDHVLREGSIVHYRYGVFTGTSVMSHDGTVSSALVSPNGELVADARDAAFAPPAWARNPFSTGAPAAPGAAVLLDERFLVRQAIRHSNRGGVFRATDQRNGAAVVVKQARAHVGGDRDGGDVRDRLRHEYTMLLRLAPTQLAPQPEALFEQGSDLFLVEQDLASPTLRTWVGTLRTSDEVFAMVKHLLEALMVVHAYGIVVRDLSPNNLLVLPDRSVRLIDLELAAVDTMTRDWCRRSGTAAYASPEQLAGAAPGRAMDVHAVGALLLFAFTGEDPLVGADGSVSLRDWAGRSARATRLPAGVADLAVRLCGPEPDRPELDDARQEIESLAARAHSSGWRAHDENAVARMALNDLTVIDESSVEDAIEGLLGRLLADVAHRGARIFRASSYGETTMATNVQHGAAGLLGVLVQAARLRGDTRAAAAAADVAAWIQRAPTPRGGAVGLHFGHAGPAWALAEAGELLGDRRLTNEAVERVLSLPENFPGPDIAQGRAGLGLTAVRLWQLCQDERLAALVARLARRLVDEAGHDASGTWWSTPTDTSSVFAGKRFHGFAHGTAGIGAFLFYAGALMHDDRLAAVTARAGHTLLRNAVERPGGQLLWGSGPDDPLPGLAHWCNGSSGVSTFLARAYDGPDVRRVLDGAARAIVAAKWQSGTTYCHGLAGNADALLDISETIAGPYRDQAGDLLRLLWERRLVDERGPGLTDDPSRITPDFGVGYAGGLSVFLRYRHGGSRLWLPREW